MVRNNEKISWSRLVFLIYLIFALTASFAFSPDEALIYVDSYTDRLEAAGYFSITDHTLDWLAENITTIRRANRHSSFFLCNGLIRVYTSVETCVVASCLVGFCFQVVKTDNTFIAKNNIPLKLRV